MATKGLFIFVAFAALALASEIEEAEQKKRGAGKPNALNSIPTGAQKTDYTYNIYPQNSQSSPSQSYQSQVPSSFYPSQTSSQYYASANADTSPSHSSQTQSTQSQFVPINFVPNPGYQSKYQIPLHKPNAVQLAVIQQPTIQPSSMLQYASPFFSHNPTNHISQGPLLGPLSHGHFSFGPSYHPFTLGGHLISQPPTMVVLPQPQSSLYNNLVYPNPSQSFYNYYPSSSQAKYSYSSGPPINQSNEYDKVQTSITQSVSKEENGVNVPSTDYNISPTDANSAYKNAYTSRSIYSKI